jgi:alpha-tubulin suppressor-like RCC1 family protein
VPQAVFAGSRVVMVSCGGGHTMAVTAAGHAWSCGRNGSKPAGRGRHFKQADVYAGGRRAARGREDRDGGVRMVSQNGGVGGGARVDLWLWW